MAVELNAILMAAGHGSRLPDITANIPKCLLPVCGRPLICYSLWLLQRAAFREVLVVVQEEEKPEVQQALERSGLHIRADLVAIPSGVDWGTADSLRFLYQADRIKSDVLIVSCDLITNINLQNVVNVFRKHRAAVTALYFEAPSEPLGTTPGPKVKGKSEHDIVGLDPSTGRLVFLASASDFEDTVVVRRVLLRKHARMVMHSRLVDAHLYILQHWVCQYLEQERSFSTLKGELLPYIVKKQLAKPVTANDSDLNASIAAVDIKKDLLHCAAVNKLDLDIRQMSTFNDHRGDMHPAYHGDSILCYAHVAEAGTFGMRANTLANYCYLNRKVVELWPSVTDGCKLVPVHPGSEVRSTQVDASSLVGEHSVVSEKTSIKSTIIGPHCTVEAKVRLSDCIIMSGVHIMEGCVLTNCVVCDGAEISNGAELKDCVVGNKHLVTAGEKHNNELLTDAEHLMEI